MFIVYHFILNSYSYGTKLNKSLLLITIMSTCEIEARLGPFRDATGSISFQLTSQLNFLFTGKNNGNMQQTLFN